MDKDVETLSKEELIDLVKQLIKRVEALEVFIVEVELENERLRQGLGQKQPHPNGKQLHVFHHLAGYYPR